MNCPHWLLALTIPFSRSDRARTSPEALVPGGPKDCSGQIAPLASFLRLPEGPGRPLGGKKTLPDRHGTVNAPNGTSTTGLRPGASSQVHRTGDSVGPGGWDPMCGERSSPGSVPVTRLHRPVACGEPPGPPHATRCSKPNGLSAPSLARGQWERAPPADFFDLPQVCELLSRELDPSLLHRDDKAVTARMTPHCAGRHCPLQRFQQYVKSSVFSDT